MLVQTFLVIIFTKILLVTATREFVTNVSWSGDRVVLSMSDTSQRFRCPSKDRSPVIERAWYGLTSLMDKLDCK